MACTLGLRVITRYFAKAVMHNNGPVGGNMCKGTIENNKLLFQNSVEFTTRILIIIESKFFYVL